MSGLGLGQLAAHGFAKLTGAQRAAGATAPVAVTASGSVVLPDGTEMMGSASGNIGATGATGRGISTVVRTSGTGAPGTTDTYTITYSDATTSTFDVYNGADGSGSGDMLASAYDTNADGKVNSADVADAVAWTGVTGKPTTFTPAAHSHVIADVTGLQTAIDGKEPTIAAGTTAQFWQGNKTWQDLFTQVRAATLTGLSTATNAAIAAADTVLVAFGKLQAQMTAHFGSGGASHADATTSVAGFMASTDKTKLDGIAAGAQVNVATNIAQGTRTSTTVPVTSSTGTSATLDVASTTLAGVMSAADKTKLDGVATGATNYTHPASHPPSIITQDASNRFVTDTEKATWNAKGDVTLTGTQTLTNKTLTTPLATGLRETRTAMGANAIDLATGNFFSKTISGATTFTVSNVPAAGTAATFILDLTNGGSAAITWFAGVKWAGGTAPTLTASGRDVLGFFTHNGGTVWTGLVMGKDVK